MPSHALHIGTEDFEGMKFLIAFYAARKDRAVLFSQSPPKSAFVVQNLPAEISVLKAERTATAFDVALIFIDGAL